MANSTCVIWPPERPVGFFIGKDRTDARKTKCGNGGLVPSGNKIMLILESQAMQQDSGLARKIQKYFYIQLLEWRPGLLRGLPAKA